MPKPPPIGEILIERRVLNKAQVDQILEYQKNSRRPFGELAEDLFGVSAKDVEQAWSEQYAEVTSWIDPTTTAQDPAVHGLVSRRQAWQFRVLPVRHDGSELMVCTTKDGLVRAMNFVTRHLPYTCFFVLAKPELLAQSLMRLYELPGLSVDAILGDGTPNLMKTA